MFGFKELQDHGFGKKRIKREPMITAAELAREKGVSQQSISELMKSCSLTFKKVKSKKYYQRSELLNWYESAIKNSINKN